MATHGKLFESVQNVAPRVETGFVDTAILDRIEQWGPDLVILGTHGRGGFERFLLGSVASTVVRDGWTNVLVIPPRRPVRWPLRQWKSTPLPEHPGISCGLPDPRRGASRSGKS